LKLRYIVLAWISCFIISVIPLFVIEINLINLIGINVGYRERQTLSYLGLIIFQVLFSISTSLILTMIIWKFLNLLKKPETPVYLLISEIIRSCFILLVFEILTGIIYIITIAVTEDPYVLTILQFDPKNLIKLSWLNFFLVCIFYAFIGFQSARKNKIESNSLSLSDRLIYDFLQLFIIFFCLLLGLYPIFYFQFTDLMSFLLSTLYYTTVAVTVIEFITWLNLQKKNEKINEFIYRLQGLLVPSLVIIHTIPGPFYLLLFSDFYIYLLLIISCIIISYLVAYFAVKPTQSSPKIARVLKKQINSVFYFYESTIANRGAAFDYPKPIDIIHAPQKTDTIETRFQKVKLKMACGQCFHVFEAETYREKGKMKPVECPFCHSFATTPVWE